MSISAFSGSQVPFAYDPPNSTCTICGYFETCLSTKSKAIVATLDFSCSSFFVGTTPLLTFSIIFFILL